MKLLKVIELTNTFNILKRWVRNQHVFLCQGYRTIRLEAKHYLFHRTNAEKLLQLAFEWQAEIKMNICRTTCCVRLNYFLPLAYNTFDNCCNNGDIHVKKIEKLEITETKKLCLSVSINWLSGQEFGFILAKLCERNTVWFLRCSCEISHDCPMLQLSTADAPITFQRLH